MTWNVVKSEFNQWTNKISKTVVEDWTSIEYALESVDILQKDVPKYRRITYSVESA